MGNVSEILVEERDSRDMSGNALFSKTSRVGILKVKRLFLSHVHDLADVQHARFKSSF